MAGLGYRGLIHLSWFKFYCSEKTCSTQGHSCHPLPGLSLLAGTLIICLFLKHLISGPHSPRTFEDPLQSPISARDSSSKTLSLSSSLKFAFPRWLVPPREYLIRHSTSPYCFPPTLVIAPAVVVVIVPEEVFFPRSKTKTKKESICTHVMPGHLAESPPGPGPGRLSGMRRSRPPPAPCLNSPRVD